MTSTEDLLRRIVVEWTDGFRDDATGWEQRVDALVAEAREHLNPALPGLEGEERK